MNKCKSLKSIRVVIKRCALVSLLMLTVPQTTLAAATLDDVVKSIDNLRYYIQGVVELATKQLAEKLYEPNPSMPATIAGNQGQETAQTTLKEKIYNLTLAQVKQSLSEKSNRQATALARIPASDTLLASTGPSIFGTREKVDLTKGDANFDLETFLAPSSYTPERAEQATNFVQLISGAYQPASTLALDDLTADQITALRRSSAYRDYQLALRSYVATQSVGLDNLYYLLAERITQAGLGEKAGVRNNAGHSVKDASPLQVKEYLANRRVTNPQWYDQMSKASPATVSRETLFVLAEIRQELFNIQQQNERLLAVFAVMQLQTSGGSSNVLRSQEEVKNQINRIKGVPTDSSGIPGLPTNP